MAMLLHITGDGRRPLSPFAGHLVRNLDRERFGAEAADAGVDAVIVASPSPEEAVTVVDELRRQGRQQPVVLISDGSPGWESVAGAFELVQVTGGSPEELARALEVAGLGSTSTVGAQERDPAESNDVLIDLRPPVPRGGGRGLLRERLGDNARLLTSSGRGFADLVAAPAAQDPVTVAPDPRPPTPPVVDAAPSVGHPMEQDPQAERDGSRRGSWRRNRAADNPDVLVPALLTVTDRLYGVRETGSALAAHVHEVVGVDAVAVMVPDGRMWVVAGAVGHRHLEERLVLGQEHWLVQQVGQAHHGLVIEDTDIVRTRLSGAPLAAWPFVMACPVGDVGIMVMARGDGGPPFSARDLFHASESLAEAEQLLTSALDVRELARRLLTFAELDDPGLG